MAGLFITPRQEDYERLSPERALSILAEVSLSKDEVQQVIERLKSTEAKKQSALNSQFSTRKEPNVTVGIITADKITVRRR